MDDVCGLLLAGHIPSLSHPNLQKPVLNINRLVILIITTPQSLKCEEATIRAVVGLNLIVEELLS